MNFLGNHTRKIVYTINNRNQQPSTSNSCNRAPTLAGVLHVRKTPAASQSERVKIVVSLRTLSKERPLKDWSQIITKKQPTTVNRREFVIDKNCWINAKGVNWVIPTPIFGETSIQIELGSSALLATGFIIEVFRRDSIIVHEVPASENLSAGCSINFCVSWNLSANSKRATPTVTPLRWVSSPTDNEAASASGSQLSLQSGQSFNLHRLGLSSEDDRYQKGKKNPTEEKLLLIKSIKNKIEVKQKVCEIKFDQNQN